MFTINCLRQSRFCLWLAGSAIVLLITCVDFTVGVQVSFSMFYLAPVALITWFGSRREADLMILLSTLAGGWIDWLRITEFSHPAMPFANAAIRVAFCIIAVAAIIVLRDSLRREKEFATLDPLTGLFNTRAFYIQAEREASRCCRKEVPLTVAFLDCDNFKEVNDTMGHRAGDEMLRVVADTMQKCLRTEDILARLGGDEFAIALPELQEDEAARVLSRLHAQLTEEMQKRQWPVTFSMGAVTIRYPVNSVDHMIHLADSLMYEAKNEGKNRTKFATA